MKYIGLSLLLISLGCTPNHFQEGDYLVILAYGKGTTGIVDDVNAIGVEATIDKHLYETYLSIKPLPWRATVTLTNDSKTNMFQPDSTIYYYEDTILVINHDGLDSTSGLYLLKEKL